MPQDPGSDSVDTPAGNTHAAPQSNGATRRTSNVPEDGPSPVVIQVPTPAKDEGTAGTSGANAVGRGQAQSKNGAGMGASLARLFECLVQEWTVIEEAPVSDGSREKRVFALIRQKTGEQKAQAAARFTRSNAGGDRFDYESKYPEDPDGEGMAANARVWRMYLDEATHFDVDMVENIRGTVDVILVFAGLYSAVVSTLVTQASTALQPDFGQVTAALLMELIELQRAMVDGTVVGNVPRSLLNIDSPSTGTSADRWVNSMWFVSLAFGLATALLSVLVKQWIQAYMAPTFGTPHSQSRVRHFRYMGIQQWHVPLIAGLLPILLHIALFLFFIGLIIFLFTIDHVIAGCVTLVGVLAYSAYMIANILPAFYAQCPYRTPLSTYAYFAVRKMRPMLRKILNVLNPSLQHLARLYAHARSEFHQVSSAVSILSDLYLPAAAKSHKLNPIPLYPWEVRSKPLNPVTLQAMDKSAVESDGELLDAEMLTWLCKMSANPSVRSVVVKAASDLPIGFTALSAVRNGLLRTHVTHRPRNGEEGLHLSTYTHAIGSRQVFSAPYSGAPTADNGERIVQCACEYYVDAQQADIVAREQRLTVLGFLPPSDYSARYWAREGRAPTANDLRALYPPATSKRAWILLLRHALRSQLESKSSTFDIQRDIPTLRSLFTEFTEIPGDGVTFNRLQMILLGAYLCQWTLPWQTPFRHPDLLNAALLHEERLLRLVDWYSTSECRDHYLSHVRIHVLVHYARSCSSGVSIFAYAKANPENFRIPFQALGYSGGATVTLSEDHPLLEQLPHLIPTPDVVRHLLEDSADGDHAIVQLGEDISILCMLPIRSINNEILCDKLKENDLIGALGLLIEPRTDHGSQLDTDIISQLWLKVDFAMMYVAGALSRSTNAKAHLDYILAHLFQLCRWAFPGGAYTVEEDPSAHTENVGEPRARRSYCIREVGEYMANHMSHTEYLARWNEVTKEVSGFLLVQGHSEREVELFAQALNADVREGWNQAERQRDQIRYIQEPRLHETDAVIRTGILSSTWSRIRSVIPSSKRIDQGAHEMRTSSLPNATELVPASSSVPQTGTEAV